MSQTSGAKYGDWFVFHVVLNFTFICLKFGIAFVQLFASHVHFKYKMMDELCIKIVFLFLQV